jgi:hypothetical protein
MHTELDMNGNRIINYTATPVNGDDITNKAYVDARDSLLESQSIARDNSLESESIARDNNLQTQIDGNLSAIQNIEVSGTIRQDSEEFTATLNQTDFTLTSATFAGDNTLAVYINGVRQSHSSYTTFSTDTVIFSEGLQEGDKVLLTVNESVSTTFGIDQIEGLEDSLTDLEDSVTGLTTATIQTLLSVDPTVSSTVFVKDYHSDVEGGGGGTFYWDATGDKTKHNGGTIIDPDVVFPSDWTNQTQLTTWFTAGTGTGCWVRQYDGAVNIEWFGAKGDGLSDDTAVINKTVNVVGSFSGGTVYIPDGQYSISSSIMVNNPDVRLVGASRGATVLLPDVDISCIVFDFGGTAKGGWGVENLSIRYSDDGTSGAAIRSLSGLSGTIREVYIERCYDGIELGNCQATHIEHVELWYNVNYGIFLNDNLNDVYLTEIFINGSQFGTSAPRPSSVGIFASGKSHAIMANNIEIVQSKSPMQLSGSTTDDVLKPAFSTFVNCFFDSSLEAVLLLHCRTLKFVGCWFSNRGDGLVVSNCTDTDFIGCSFVNSDNHGCIVQASSVYTRFTDCTFDSNGQSSSGTFNGLTFATGTSDWQVSGGLFGNLGTFPATQASGVSVQGVSDRYSIIGATFTGNTTSAVYDSGTGTEKYISQNIGYRTSNKGVANILATTTSVVVNHGLNVTPSISDFLLTRASGNAGSTDLYVSNVTATQFTINTAAAPSSEMLVSWDVRTSS